MKVTGVKLAVGLVMIMAATACSQEKVCEMGAKAYATNTANLAKMQAEVDKNPTDTNRKLLEKAKANQAKLEENLKAAQCPGIAAPAAATTAAAAEGSASPSTGATNTLGEGTFIAADGSKVRAVYNSDETVTLTLADGSTKTLKQAVSGSGIRFTGDGLEWIEHQGEGMLSQGDKQIFSGKDQRNAN